MCPRSVFSGRRGAQQQSAPGGLRARRFLNPLSQACQCKGACSFPSHPLLFLGSAYGRRLKGRAVPAATAHSSRLWPAGDSLTRIGGGHAGVSGACDAEAQARGGSDLGGARLCDGSIPCADIRSNGIRCPSRSLQVVVRSLHFRFILPLTPGALFGHCGLHEHVDVGQHG